MNQYRLSAFFREFTIVAQLTGWMALEKGQLLCECGSY